MIIKQYVHNMPDTNRLQLHSISPLTHSIVEETTLHFSNVIIDYKP